MNGAQWNSLGKFNLDSGAQQLKVSNEDSGSQYVIFDAFKFVYTTDFCTAGEVNSSAPVDLGQGNGGPCLADDMSEKWAMGVLVVLGLVMICWANSARIWARRLAEAENRTPKVVYVQIPLHVQNPGEDSDALAVLETGTLSPGGSSFSDAGSVSSSRGNHASSPASRRWLRHTRTTPASPVDEPSNNGGVQMEEAVSPAGPRRS